MKSRVTRSPLYHWIQRAIHIKQKRTSIVCVFGALVIITLTFIAYSSVSYAAELEDAPYRDPRATVIPVYQESDKTPIAYYVGRQDGTNMLCTRTYSSTAYTCVISN